ncbi:MAG: enterochelin esterase [Bryobacteraceae bacterium]|jgi:enterochelin esterase family protein
MQPSSARRQCRAVPPIGVAILLTGLAVSAQTPTHSEADANASPRISALRKEVESGRRQAAQRFWQEVRKAGAPWVESIPGDGANSLVTFLWQGDSTTRNVAIFDGVAGFDATDRMTHLAGTDVWYKTYKVRDDARFAYNLSPNDSLDSFDNIKDDEAMKKRLAMFRTDPLNPRRCPSTFGELAAESSYVELSAAPPQPWNAPRADVPKGAVTATTFRSAILKNERKLWIYTPAGFSKSGAPYPLLALFDGDRNVKWVPAILDNLIARKRIPPMVAALVDNPSSAARNLELPCYPPFADFLALELVPYMRENFHAAADPAHTIAAGSSYGGLAAVFASLRHPEVFGNVVSLSGSFWWKPQNGGEAEWLTRQVADTPKLPLRFYLEVGLMEGYAMQIEANRRMRDVLAGQGYEIGYGEYDGGHSFLNWSGGTANGLLFLMGSK